MEDAIAEMGAMGQEDEGQVGKLTRTECTIYLEMKDSRQSLPNIQKVYRQFGKYIF